MANLKSSKKDIRRTDKRTLHNRSIKSKVRTYLNKVNVLMKNSSSTAENIKSALQEFESVIMKAAKNSIVNKLAASRKISKMTMAFKKKYDTYSN